MLIHLSVETIGDSCFLSCRSLWDFTFKSRSNISRLGGWVFCGSSSLRLICIPSSLEDIAGNCFSEYEKLVNILFDEGCKLSFEVLLRCSSRNARFESNDAFDIAAWSIGLE
jgi:hypothetical protein